MTAATHVAALQHLGEVQSLDGLCESRLEDCEDALAACEAAQN